MAGGKGKSIGGKATGAKDSTSKTQKSHSAKAGLQVRSCLLSPDGCDDMEAPIWMRALIPVRGA